MPTIAISDSWSWEQLVKLHRTQPSIVQRAVQHILEEDEDLRWSVVINAYLDHEISLARAAYLLNLHPLELRDQFTKKGIPLYIGPEDKADAQSEVDSLKAWRRSGETHI